MNEIYAVPFSCNLINQISEFLISSTGRNDLSSYKVVFPGKRPGIYLLEKLKEITGDVFIPPERQSIDEFMQEMYKLDNADEVVAGEPDILYLLYRAIKECKLEDENLEGITDSFGRFIEWGPSLIRTLEEIDVEKAELKNLESLVKYSDNVATEARALWDNITTIRKKFYNLMDIYSVTCRGKYYNYVSDNIKDLAKKMSAKKIVFAGFYALNRTQETVMKYLFDAGRAEIIIQTDVNNFKDSPSSPSYFHKMLRDKWNVDFKLLCEDEKKRKNVEIFQAFDTHSEVIKIRDILENLQTEGKTVIVLPDNKPLMPLLYNVVSSFDMKFNITMGYPVKRTSVANMLNYIFNLQRTKRKENGNSFYYAVDYLNLIKHPWIKNLKKKNGDVGGELFKKVLYQIENYIKNKNNNELELFFSLEEIEEWVSSNIEKRIEMQGRMEEIEKRVKEVNSMFVKNFEDIENIPELTRKIKTCFKRVLRETEIKKHPVSSQILYALFKRLDEIENSIFSEADFEGVTDLMKFTLKYMNNLRVVFSGRPLEDFQIMGLLETRNLNFDSVIIMDVNEGIIPGLYRNNPLLPEDLRKAAGLPEYKDKESLYSHNFFRLIEGSKNVYLFYKEGRLYKKEKNIKSRFIERILWDSEKEENKIEPIPLLFNVEKNVEEIEIFKTDEVLNRLRKIHYSPSSIDTYLNCPLRFYYKKILKLEEKKEIEEDIESLFIGNFIHEFLKEYYAGREGEKLVVDIDSFRQELEKKVEREIRGRGGALILKEMIYKFMDGFIKEEKKRIGGDEVTLVNVERRLRGNIEINGINFNLTGIVDRIEKKNELYRIIDFKTGTLKYPGAIKDKDILEDRESIKKKVNSFQLPLYKYMFIDEMGGEDLSVKAFLYNIRRPAEKKFLINNSYSEYIKLLKIILEEIVNPHVPFKPDDTELRYCSHCPYNLICSTTMF